MGFDSNWTDSEIRRKEEQLSIWQERKNLSIGPHVFKIVLGVALFIIGIIVLSGFARTWRTSSLVWGYLLIIAGMVLLGLGIAFTIVKSIQRNRSYDMCRSIQGELNSLYARRNEENAMSTADKGSSYNSTSYNSTSYNGSSYNSAASYADPAPNDSSSAASPHQIEPENNLRQPSGQDFDTLIRYKELLDKGIITQEEFDIKKSEFLNGGGVSGSGEQEEVVPHSTTPVEDRLEYALKFSSERGLRDYILSQAEKACSEEEKEVFGRLQQCRIYEMRDAVGKELAALMDAASAATADPAASPVPEVPAASPVPEVPAASPAEQPEASYWRPFTEAFAAHSEDSTTRIDNPFEDISYGSLDVSLEQQPVSPQIQYCHNCGAALREGTMFCHMCGAKVR